MSRRNSRGEELQPQLYDSRSYDERQIGTDNLAERIEQFLNRWHWRGDRKVVRQELEELIEIGRAG
jgi:hypothetical protein